MSACNYRPKDAALRATFALMLEVGDTRRSNQGGLSNAYRVARDTGRMPAWCQPGTPAYAAAKAGLCNRERAACSEQKPAI